jgi:phage/plasmid-like protein (TIGR03299 family)
MSSPIDPNEAFSAERAQQLSIAAQRQASLDARIAAGKLQPLSGGRYRITDPDSWDNGEILRLADGFLMPEHGLDVVGDRVGDRVALYSAVPAWHGLGNVIPGGISDIDAVLRLGGIDFTVGTRPMLYQPAVDAPIGRVADGFVTVRGDTGAALGAVGTRYTVLQNREVFAFLQTLVDEYEVTWESAGSMRGGREVFVSMRLPRSVVIDKGGVEDEIVPFIVAINTHDGTSRFLVMVTPWRPVCGNTERFAVRDAAYKWGVKHTKNAIHNVRQARNTLRLSLAYYDEFAAEEELLAQTDLALREYERVIETLWTPPEPGASTRMVNSYRDRRDTLVGLYEANADRLGRTAYAGERALTEYLDWKREIRPSGVLAGNRLNARITTTLEGVQDDRKSAAHRELMTLARR